MPNLTQNITNTGECSPERTYIPNIYTQNEELRKDYAAKYYQRVLKKNSAPRDLPAIHSFTDATFIIWRSDFKSFASAYNATHEMEGEGWRPRPEEEYGEPIVLEGDYIAYTAWYEGNFGHFFDDHMPSIAYLRTQFNWNTKILLMDTKLSRDVMRYLDPQFEQERIVWIPERRPIKVTGSLHVNRPVETPLMLGCQRPYDFMRHWVVTRFPTVPQKRTVLFYSRHSKSTFHGRVVDRELEKQLINAVREAMVIYNRSEEELVVYTGEDEQGNQLSIEEQHKIFRSAKTIIGPHGAGMLGNMIWADPMPGKCERRVQVLEFIPSPESRVVQPAYQSLFIRWRTWPVEFHTILYSAQSTSDLTFVNIGDFKDALQGMWGTREADAISHSIPQPVAAVS